MIQSKKKPGGHIFILKNQKSDSIFQKVNMNVPFVYYGKVSLEFYLISVFIRNIVSLYVSEVTLTFFLCIIISLSIFFLSTIVANICKRILDRIVFFNVTNN